MIMFIKIVLVLVEVIASLLLIGVILLQKTKSGGMGGAFGGGAGEAIFGAQMGNVLTKITVVLAVIFLVNTTILSLLGTRGIEDRGPAEKANPMQNSEPIGSGVDEVMPIVPDASSATAPISQETVPDSNLPTEDEPIKIPAE